MIQDDIYSSKMLLTKACFNQDFATSLANSFQNILTSELPNKSYFNFNNDDKYFEISDTADQDVYNKLYNCLSKQIYMYYDEDSFKNQLLNVDPDAYHKFHNLMNAVLTSYATNPNSIYTLQFLSQQLYSILNFGNGYYRINLI